MDLEILEAGGTVVVKVRGDLDVYSSPDLTGRCTVLVKEGKTDLAFDLAEVRFVDSSGVGALIRACQVLQRHGRRLMLLNPSKSVRKVIRSMSLDNLFEIRDSAELQSAATIEGGPEWRRGKRILVVAEDASILAATKQVLLEEGYGVVLEGSHYLEVLRQANRHMVHLIIIDLSHPLESTQKILDSLRADGKETPVAITSVARWGASGDESPASNLPFAIDGESRRRFLTLVNSALTGEELGFRDHLRARLGLT